LAAAEAPAAAAARLALLPALLERRALLGGHVLQALFHHLLALFRRHVGEATAAAEAASAALAALFGARLLSVLALRTRPAFTLCLP
jgi:hypothetical protein